MRSAMAMLGALVLSAGTPVGGTALAADERLPEGWYATGSHPQDYEIGLDEARFEVLEIEQQGEVVLEVGEYTLHSTQESGAVVNRGRYLIVHRSEGDGRWRRAAEMLSPDGAAAVRSNHGVDQG